MARDRFSAQITMDKKKKDHIVNTYKRMGFNIAKRIELLMDEDIAELLRTEKWKRDDS